MYMIWVCMVAFAATNTTLPPANSSAQQGSNVPFEDICPEDGGSCACEDFNCYKCTVWSQEPNGQMCLQCRFGKYYLNGRCVSSCPIYLHQTGVSSIGNFLYRYKF